LLHGQQLLLLVLVLDLPLLHLRRDIIITITIIMVFRQVDTILLLVQPLQQLQLL